MQELAVVVQSSMYLLLRSYCVATGLEHQRELELLDSLVLLKGHPLSEVPFDDRPEGLDCVELRRIRRHEPQIDLVLLSSFANFDCHVRPCVVDDEFDSSFFVVLEFLTQFRQELDD